MLELGTTPADTPADLIKDVTEATFMADVIEASQTKPVIVDFWAEWCGPCKQLGPLLEAEVTAQKGKVTMAKIDVDKNQRIAQQMRIQSIPAVFAFVGGQPVDGFMGAQTPAQIKEFVTKIAAMSADEGDGLEEALAAADEMFAEGAIADAMQTYAAILEEDENNMDALAGMMRCRLATGEADQARALLGMVPAGQDDHPAITSVRAQIDLAEAAAGAGETDTLRAAVDADPADHQARFDLATALLANNEPDAAVEELLELFRRDREWNEGAARTQLIKIFDSLGPKDPLALKGRRRLSSMIFA